ncbi:tetratricopeptide repeat protein [Cupriavidus sp. SS-3]|uniref:tetratricopeptide repeat protein n=1 Tax=Cupriavidus sp. SS-3 TaxID=3109596 RepID=UPI002DBE691C|nr:tetratricopeptide repeat protein [Cupriavidus sp. SS-3]MEC3767503.1 tetratricopeptide repeat protein [Cupriavidus sp. SS-3]
MRMNLARKQEQENELGLAELLRQAASLYAKEQYSQAFRIYRHLADQGHSESQVFLGCMFAEGKGVQASQEDAAHWFRRAAELGSARGGFYLGRLLTMEGKHADAFPLYQRSAAAGYPPSQFRLGVSYLRGQGVRRDLTLAFRYLEAAKANGHIFARRELAILDILGYRGVARRFLGVIEFLHVLLFGMGVAFANPYSDDLRG